MIGPKIRRIRTQNGLSQVALAAELGISPSYLSLMESDQRSPTLELLLKLTQRFGVRLEDFSDEHEGRLVADLAEAFGDPALEDHAVGRDEVADMVGVAPEASAAVADLYRAYREADDALTALRERLLDDAFLSDSVHRLVTLLTSIRSFSEIVRDHANLGADERQRFLDIIAEESQRLSDVAGEFVEYARGDHLERSYISVSPVEEVTEFVERNGNYFDALEAAAVELRREVEPQAAAPLPALADHLENRHRIVVRRVAPGECGGRDTLLDRDSGILQVDETLPAESLAFALARRIAAFGSGDAIGAVLGEAGLSEGTARALGHQVLAGYVAGAMLLPYEPFLRAARELRYDLDRLMSRFGASFEQVCHRLTTMQRPGAAGVPFHFLRVDVAGNITKRFRGTGMAIPRFGSACALWAAHRAFLTPGRLHVQVSEMPDGVRYLSVARTVRRPGGSYGRPDAYVAVELGCGIERARELIYADGLDLAEGPSAVPVGVSCRMCERTDCRQRAHPSLILESDADPAPAEGVSPPPGRPGSAG